MSYILDALKKSERQRPPGQVPDLFTVHGPQPPSPRWPARAIVAGALLLSIPAIALWAWIGTDRRDEGADRPPAAASGQRHAESAAARATPRTVASSTPPRQARGPVVAVPAARKPVGERPQTPAPPAPKPREAASSAPAPLMPPAAPQAGSAPATAEPPAAPIFMTPAPVGSEPAAIPPPPQPGGGISSATAPPPEMSPPDIPVADVIASPAVSAAENAPPADGRVLEMDGLPESIRAELPKLLVSGHVWSEEPALRLLSVDDRLLHEGGEAAPGVRLQEITPAGAVFVFKGWHFRVPGGGP